MRSIPILVLAWGFAVCLLDASATVGAAGPSQPAPTTPQADCRAVAPAAPGGTVDERTDPACGQTNVASRLAPRRAGFWTAQDVGPGSSGNAADPLPTVLHVADAATPSGAPACESYPLLVVVGGQPRQATVVACPQADGGWQATQFTPGLPPQIYTVSPPPAAGASPNDYASPGYYQDCGWDWAGAPWFWGFAPAVVVVQRFSHSYEFNHGFAHGFGHGFEHGFAHGSAGGHGGFGGMRR